MAKSIDNILSDAGLRQSFSASPAEADAGLSDSPVKERSDLGVSTAPSIGSGKVEGLERLVGAASDAFRQARVEESNTGSSYKKPRDRVGRPAMEEVAPYTGAGTATPQATIPPIAADVEMVRTRPKRVSPSDAATADKVVVVSRSQGKIIGRQG